MEIMGWAGGGEVVKAVGVVYGSVRKQFIYCSAVDFGSCLRTYF